MKILTAAEMREVDRLTSARENIPSLQLMENAGASVAEFIFRRFQDFKALQVVVLCGKGNNGGDGFVVARHLRDAGVPVFAFLFANPEDLKGDAAENLIRWRKTGEKVHPIRTPEEWQVAKTSIRSADLIVDALLGTGIRGPVEGLIADAIREVNERGAKHVSIIAVDIPSGLPADGEETQGPVVKADYTVTFTAPKIGMFAGRSGETLGELIVSDIGSSRELIDETGKGNCYWSEAQEFAAFAKRRKADSNKGSYGHALIVAGSYGKSGAAIMASWAALRVGAGLVTVAIPEPALAIVAARNPEIMTEPLPATSEGSISLKSFENGRFDKIVEGKKALGIGPGLTTNNETQQFVHKVVGNRALPIVLDADGLNAFASRAAELKNATGNLALTPHPGEMSRLLGCKISEIQADRLRLARKAAADWNAFVILKGQYTVVAAPDGRAYINSTGNPGMSTAGTGDVLTGMLAGLTAQFGAEDWLRALAFGVYLHGLAGDIAYRESGETPLMATDLILHLPAAYREFYEECGRD
jgi:ADP-dependent NAD(P)H-hydrate dehydratase / NAD(P)H-hydrate epimerase